LKQRVWTSRVFLSILWSQKLGKISQIYTPKKPKKNYIKQFPFFSPTKQKQQQQQNV
jgi:hypothetical protein